MDHHYYMQLAMEQAHIAYERDEVPIGAILVYGNDILGREHNRTQELGNPLAHAEKMLIDNLCPSKMKYLYDCRLYVTLEPCVMCAGMMIWRRLGNLIFAAYDPKAGAVGSVYNVLLDKSFNHHPVVVSGVMERESKDLLQAFFRRKRK